MRPMNPIEIIAVLDGLASDSPVDALVQAFAAIEPYRVSDLELYLVSLETVALRLALARLFPDLSRAIANQIAKQGDPERARKLHAYLDTRT
jgi:hypothetical protein